MITILCNYIDDKGNTDSTVTRINCTIEEARKYFLNQYCNVGIGPDDNIMKCISVELI